MNVSGDSGIGATGPEVGSHAYRVFSTATAQTGAMGFSTWADFSIMFMATFPAAGGIPGSSYFMGLGDVGGNNIRGIRFGQASSAVKNQQVWPGTTNMNMTTSVWPWPETFWHLGVFTYINSTTTRTFYVDGAVGTPATGLLGISPTGGDALWIKSSNALVISHVAFWTRALTTTEVQSVSSQIQTWPYGEPINVPVVGGSTTVDLSPVLTQTTEILNNQSTAMPQLTYVVNTTNTIQGQTTTIHTDTQNMVNTLFPQLADAINAIIGDITSTVTTAAGNVSRTVGQMLTGHQGDTLTENDFGTTCDSTAASYELGGGLFFSAQFIVTSMPDWYVFTGPGDTYTEQSLGTIEFHRGGSLQKRIGLHTTTHTEAPLPGVADVPIINEWSVVPADYQIVVYPAPGVCINTKGFHLP